MSDPIKVATDRIRRDTMHICIVLRLLTCKYSAHSAERNRLLRKFSSASKTRLCKVTNSNLHCMKLRKQFLVEGFIVDFIKGFGRFIEEFLEKMDLFCVFCADPHD